MWKVVWEVILCGLFFQKVYRFFSTLVEKKIICRTKLMGLISKDETFLKTALINSFRLQTFTGLVA